MKINPIGYNFFPKSINKLAQTRALPLMPCDSVHFTGKPLQEEPKLVVIMLGAPNSGKGTCAREISNKYGIPQISTGDILRNEIKKDTELGKEVKSYMNSGALVPDDVILDVFKNRIQQDDCKNGFILDGFPRTTQQAEKLQTILEADKNINLKIINLDVDKDILYERSSNRYMCEDCSKTHSIKEGYVKGESKCDCGGNLIKRADDTPEVLTQRLDAYEKQTKPIIDLYGDKVQNVSVVGEDAPLQLVLSEVFDIIEY